MTDYHVVLGATSILLGVIGYIFYFRSIFRGITKPHPFTWFTYGIIDVIVFIAQVIKGAGPGAWTLGFSAVVVFAIAALALKWGEKRITRSDWLCFVGALMAIVFWIATDDPLYAVIIATGINILAILPTFRKSYLRPNEEALSMWSLDAAKYAVSIFALETANLTTALFPFGIVVTNGILVAVVLLRRRKLAKLRA